MNQKSDARCEDAAGVCDKRDAECFFRLNTPWTAVEKIRLEDVNCTHKRNYALKTSLS